MPLETPNEDDSVTKADKFRESETGGETTKISNEDKAHFRAIEDDFESFKNNPEFRDKPLKYNVGDTIKAPLPPKGITARTEISISSDQESKEMIDWTIVKAEAGHYLLETRTDSKEAPVSHVICDEDDLKRWGNEAQLRGENDPVTKKILNIPDRFRKLRSVLFNMDPESRRSILVSDEELLSAKEEDFVRWEEWLKDIPI